MNTSRKTCQLPGCSDPATRGAYVLPEKQDGKFVFLCLCTRHGETGMAKGMRKISWVPKP